LLPEDLRQHAIRGRGDFHRHLIGDDLEQRLVFLHRVAHLLEPLPDLMGVAFGLVWGEHDLDRGGHAPF
jgi:hypothetical protein